MPFRRDRSSEAAEKDEPKIEKGKVETRAAQPAHAHKEDPLAKKVAEAGEPLRDPVKLNNSGEIVSYVRQLSAGEPGWDPAEKMVLIQRADLSTEAVRLADISKDATQPVVPRTAPNRVDVTVEPKV